MPAIMRLGFRYRLRAKNLAGSYTALRVGLVRAPHMGVESAGMIAAAHGFDRETRPSWIAM
jgi:hypothetical protein